MPGQTTITATEYWQDHAREKDSLLVDVSDPSDFHRLHAAGSSLVSLKDTMSLARQARAVNMKLYMISRQGRVADAFRTELQRDGIDNVVAIRGGTEAWAASGLPVCRTSPARKAMLYLTELALLIGVVTGAIVYPGMVMFVVLAAAVLIVAGLAMYEDRLASRTIRARIHGS